MKKFLNYTTIILGIISSIFFVVDYFIFYQLHPKMIAFEPIAARGNDLLLFVGIGLLVFLGFYLLSLLKIFWYLKKAKKITPFLILSTIIGVLALLLVFSDFALLTDIDKQYKLGLGQPEWSLLYPIMIFQFIATIFFIYLHLRVLVKDNQVAAISIDNNIFLLAQYLGLFCGFLGLVFTSLAFIFPGSWNLHIHTIISSIILLLPYVLIVVYWFFIKLQENSGSFYDEKQMQDVGKSAFVTLITSIVLMILIFILNYSNLQGIISFIWLPFYLFYVLFIFSVMNLYHLKRG